MTNTNALTREESNALFDLLWQAQKNADGDDAVLYQRLSDKLDNLVIEGVLETIAECEHTNRKPTDGSGVIENCLDCGIDLLNVRFI